MNHSNSNATNRTAVAMHDNLELEHRYNAVETSKIEAVMSARAK